AKVDTATGRPLVEVIRDEAEQKGTGRWTAQDALDLGVPVTAITEAVFARTLSALKDRRVEAARVLHGPSGAAPDGAGLVDAWRRVVGTAVELGVPTPAFASALAYYDGYRRERSPANLIQGLRDYFGSHGYRRVDRDGSFHTRWAQDGAEVEA